MPSLLKEKQRVRVKSLNIKGRIVYIEHPLYYQHHMRPIQIELDEPWGDAGTYIYRTDIKDIVKLKKKKKPKEDDEFDIIF